MKETIYETSGTCSRAIRVVLDDDNRIVECDFAGGCNGNTQGVAALVKGQKAEDVVERLRGLRCSERATSCPDQLSKALEQALNQTLRQ